MNIDKKIIIALIAVFVVILGGIIALAPNTQDQNQTAYEIPLKAQAFDFFDMATPADSKFIKKNNKSESTSGMVAWQNSGNFSNDVDWIMISKNYTDRLIPDKMELVSNNNSEKIYMSKNYDGNYYRVVKTFNDTDIIVSGHNLDLAEKMLNTTKVKDTSKLTSKQQVVDSELKNRSNQVKKTVDNTSKVEKTEEKTPVQHVIEKRVEDHKQQNEETNAAPAAKTSIDPLMIGGGSFTTGSADEDKTYARIYVGADHAGEEVGIKIFYSRDGASLNKGNYVTATVKDDGYITIASADAYTKYPDFASVELYDVSGKLVATQGIHLNPTSGTQYF